jgi:hypothetical protein
MSMKWEWSLGGGVQSVLVGEQCDVTSLQTSSHRASQAAKASTLDQLINPSTISHVDI